MYCTTELCLSVDKLKKNKKQGRNDVGVLRSVSMYCTFCQLLKLRILTTLLDWKRSSFQSSPFSLIRIISTKIFCGLWVLFPTRHLVEELIEIFLLVVCCVAIRLVHVNANLFLSREIDHFRMLSRLSLDITAIFATGCTLYFVSAVLWAFSTAVRVPNFKRTVLSQRERLCFRVKLGRSAQWCASSSLSAEGS